MSFHPPAWLLAALSCAPTAQEEKYVPLTETLPSPQEIAELPPDGGEEFNRLVFEKSLYLLQHARNPVDWYPWGEEAFEKAKRENKPVFLSVGYSTCHWCHVMERESFEDEEVAELLNEHFVPVKVDREERPDVDHVYMTATQALTQSGGWPMTVFLTPEGQPFFAGTYFPKRGGYGRPGMMELLPRVAQLWRENRAGLVADAERISGMLSATTRTEAGDLPGRPLLESAYEHLARSYDERHGGFGRSGPKFPVPHQLRFLLRYETRAEDSEALAMVERTLRAMRRGGIWDHVGYGFHRYSTDREWLLPHFEKMLYDQALLALAYTEAWQLGGDELYRDTTEKIFRYVLRDMTSPEGAFYSAEDADSEGEEGLFYLWRPDELREVLGEEDAELAIDYFGVEPEGNFRDQATGEKTGRSILHEDVAPEEYAASHGLEIDELERRLERMRERLFESREGRIHPLKDDKVLTDWNGLMIAALAKAARAFGEPRYAEAASSSADFVLSRLRDQDGRLLKRWREGEAALTGLLEDYAFMLLGLVELYQARFDPERLRIARELADTMIELFRDEERGGFFLTPEGGEELFMRPKEAYDGALPSGNSVAATALLRLARLTGEMRYEEVALETMRAFAQQLQAAPQGHTQFLIALDLVVGPAHEVVVVGEEGREDTREMLRLLQRPFLPRTVLVFRPEGESPPITRIAEYTAPQRAVEGKATVYVCRDFTCRAPTTDPQEVLAALAAPDPERD